MHIKNPRRSWDHVAPAICHGHRDQYRLQSQAHRAGGHRRWSQRCS